MSPPDSRCGPTRSGDTPTGGPSEDSSDRTAGSERAVSPVIGTVLMVVLTVLLASTVVAALTTFPAELDESRESFENVEADTPTGPATATGNPWEGSLGDLIQVSDSEAGATGVRIRVNFTIQPGSDTIGNSLNSLKIDLQTASPDMFSGTGQDDLEKAVVDTDNDGDAETDVEGDLNGWQVSNGGSTVKVEFSGSTYTAAEGDSIVIVLGNVDNPTTAGTYDVQIQTSGDGNWQSGQITITDS